MLASWYSTTFYFQSCMHSMAIDFNEGLTIILRVYALEEANKVQ